MSAKYWEPHLLTDLQWTTLLKFMYLETFRSRNKSLDETRWFFFLIHLCKYFHVNWISPVETVLKTFSEVSTTTAEIFKLARDTAEYWVGTETWIMLALQGLRNSCTGWCTSLTFKVPARWKRVNRTFCEKTSYILNQLCLRLRSIAISLI